MGRSGVSGDARRPIGGAGRGHHTGRSRNRGADCGARPCRMSHPRPAVDSGENGRVTVRRSVHHLLRALPAAIAAAVVVAGPVLAHGGLVPDAPPDVASLILGWSGDPLVWLPAIAALVLWWVGVRRVNAAHPANPVPRSRTVSWTLGVIAILFALDSGIERYDTTLFWVHMIQHMLLTLVAPPLLLHAGPITLLLRASSAETRRRWIFPFLHARVIQASRSRWWRGSCSPGSCGSATSRPCSTPPSRTCGSTAWSTPCTWVRRSCSGGRPSARIHRPGRCVLPRGCCTSACRCRRTRSSPSRSTCPPCRSTRTTSAPGGPGGRRRSRTSRWRARSCGSAATWPSC